MNNKKQSNINAIELKEKTDDGVIHMTAEENRKIIPREVKNLKFILSHHNNINKYNWDIDGEKVNLF